MSYVPPKPDANGSPSRPPPPNLEEPGGNGSGVVERSNAPSPEDLHFVNEMAAAGLFGELDGDELHRILEETRSIKSPSRHLDLMHAYYTSAGDPLAAQRRREADRYFILTDRDGIGAKTIAERLGALCPELGDVNLERIGSDDGPLVLRSGDHIVAIVDEYEESLDTDEVDLRVLDEAESVTVQCIVQALNTMLERIGEERRFVPILGDAHREAYVAVSVDAAVDLCSAGYLELESREEVLEHCCVEG